MSNPQPNQAQQSTELRERLTPIFWDMAPTDKAILFFGVFPRWLEDEIAFLEDVLIHLQPDGHDFQLTYTRAQAELKAMRSIQSAITKPQEQN